MRRGVGLAAATLVALPILLAGPSPIAAASVTFETPRVSSTFGVSIVFDQPVRLARAPKRAEVLLYFPGSLGAEANEVPISNGLTQALRYQLDLSQTSLKPNTRIEARWRLTFGDGTAETGPPVSVLYADTRFDWKTRSGAIVRVHWYQGTGAFGERALAIGAKAVDDASKLLGVAVQEPVDFFVYADQKPFYDALGPGTRENVGGQAVASIRTLFALITPGDGGHDAGPEGRALTLRRRSQAIAATAINTRIKPSTTPRLRSLAEVGEFEGAFGAAVTRGADWAVLPGAGGFPALAGPDQPVGSGPAGADTGPTFGGALVPS